MIGFVKKHKKAFIIGGVVIVGSVLTWWLLGPEIVAALAAGFAAPAAGVASTSPADENEPAAQEEDGVTYSSEQDLPQEENSERKREYTLPSEPVEYGKCLVNMREGRHASEEKIRTAQENGFDLKDNQTWRKDFTKYDHINSEEEGGNDNDER